MPTVSSALLTCETQPHLDTSLRIEFRSATPKLIINRFTSNLWKNVKYTAPRVTQHPQGRLTSGPIRIPTLGMLAMHILLYMNEIQIVVASDLSRRRPPDTTTKEEAGLLFSLYGMVFTTISFSLSTTSLLSILVEWYTAPNLC